MIQELREWIIKCDHCQYECTVKSSFKPSLSPGWEKVSIVPNRTDEDWCPDCLEKRNRDLTYDDLH
jgi:hypothetical protein